MSIDLGDITSIVVVGHVDHGKSTLIGRLLYDLGHLSEDRLADIKKTSESLGRRMEFAYATDQFQEEREANVTIDTTQTIIPIDGRLFLLIDAPGHKEYLKNMITGATQAKHALLMLDVKEGVREQTEKHARILKLLGIPSVAVLINKMDLVGYDEKVFNNHRIAILTLLQRDGFTSVAVLPIAAYDGDNVVKRSSRMGWYEGPTVVDYLKSCSVDEATQNTPELRFPVQLIMERNGEKLLLGRVESGCATLGAPVVIFPLGKKSTIKKILKHNEPSFQEGRMGESIALTLVDDMDVRRGVVIHGGDFLPSKTNSIVSDVFWAGPDPLLVGEEIGLECRTQEGSCRVDAIYDGITSLSLGALQPGDVGRVRVTLTRALLLETLQKNEAMARVVFHKAGQVSGCGVVVEVM